MSLPIAGRDIAYSASQNLIYVSVPGDAPAYPNTIVAVDPTTSSVAWALPVGSNPGPLALSDDGSTLWVGIDGANAFRKVTLSSTPPVVGPLHRLPMADALGYFFAASIVPLPGAPLSVAMVISDGSAKQVHVFDDGVPRPTHVKNAITAGFLVPGPPGVLFGVQSVPGDFFVFSVSPSGITQTPYYSLVNGYPYEMVRQAGRLYGNSGEVVDVSNPAAPVKAPSFGYGGRIAVRDVGKLLMLTTDMFTDPLHPTAALRILAMDTGSEITSLPLPASIAPTFSTSYGKLVYAGGDAVAFFRTEHGIVDRLELVIMHDPAIARATGGAGGVGGVGGAGGAAGAAGIGGGGAGGAPADPCPGCTFTTVAGAYGRQLAYDPSRNLIYVAAYSEAQTNANTIVTVDVSTAAVTSVVPVGSNPQVLALSDDNTTLWVGLTGSRQVRRLTTGATPVAGTAYAMPMITGSGLIQPSYARSIAALPGTPSSIAVSAFGTQSGTAVFILDNGVLRANYTQLPAIDIDLLVNGPPGYLFGIDGSERLLRDPPGRDGRHPLAARRPAPEHQPDQARLQPEQRVCDDRRGHRRQQPRSADPGRQVQPRALPTGDPQPEPRAQVVPQPNPGRTDSPGARHRQLRAAPVR